MQGSKRGAVLAEICISLALTMLAGVMVASFCVITTDYLKRAEANRSFVESVSLLEDALMKWTSAFDSSEYTITIYDTSLLASDGANEYAFAVSDGALTFEMPNGETAEYPTCAVSARFGVKHGMISCDAVYSLDDKQTHICIFRYVRAAKAGEAP